MNRNDVRTEIARRANLTQDEAGEALTALQEIITEAVTSGDKVTLPGFLSAERTHRAARSGRNPQTGEPMDIPAGYSVKLTAGAALKKAASTSS